MTAEQWVRGNSVRYFLKCEALEKVTQRLTLKNLLAFVLFTPQLRYEQSVRDWKFWMQTGNVRANNMWKTRAGWLKNMPQDWVVNKLIVNRTMFEAVDALVANVQGLGYTKAPFLLSLMFPTKEDVPVCTDVHILRALKLWPSNMTRFQLGRAQERIQRRARKAGIPSFTYQWALWDYQRSGGEPVKETSLEHDLAV